MDHTLHQGQQSIRQPTSIDSANQQQYSVRPAGVKRPFADFNIGITDESVKPDQHIARFRQPSLPPNKLQASLITGSSRDAPSDYSQRLHAASTPGPTANPLLSLSHSRYALPDILVQNLQNLGVYSIYPWQSACILGKGLISGGRNLIYTAPTGGGKSLVAEILLLKKLLNNPSKKAILVLPYVALVQEKLKWLRKLTEHVTISTPTITGHGNAPFGTQMKSRPLRLAAYFGGSRTRSSWTDVDIVICTIEKANQLINTAIEDSNIDDLGIIVVDELHMIDDEHRGYVLELMLTKLLYLDLDLQIIGMSATLSKPEVLADWLNAKYYVSKYRPVPIEEHLVYDNEIYPSSGTRDFFRTASQLTSSHNTHRPLQSLRTIAKSAFNELENPLNNAVVSLAVETASAGYGALVFCSSRQRVQSMAWLISEAMPSQLAASDTLDQRMNVVAALQALSDGFELSFSKTIVQGVGFHHAGLTIEEREIVADAFDRGIIKVMVATCSLAAGINLPARRVILHGARMGRDLVGPAMLRQMRGRAGRKGKDEIGETYLCCQKSDLEDVAALLEAQLPPVESCLTLEKRGVKRALLESIATRLVDSEQSIRDYVKRSLLFRTTDTQIVTEMTHSAVQQLLTAQLIARSEHDLFESTKLGSAVVASALTPEDGLFVHDEMQRALESFVMDSEMHIFYLFTPVQSASLTEITWLTFRDELEKLDDAGQRALGLIGVNPATVNRMVNSGAGLKETTPEEIGLARTYRRAYAALQLRDLCNEVDVNTISLKYTVPRGSIQNLAQTCHGFAAGMIKFCERMGWGMLAAVLEHMVDRLRAGARADLLEMAQVTFIKSRMARIMWENGFKSIRALAEADLNDLVPVMLMAQPRKMRLQGEAADKLREKLLDKAEVIVSSASRIWERQQLAEIDEL